jgi:hypothetical protein
MTSMHASLAFSKEFNGDEIRHIVLNMIRSINQKFGKKYGNIVIACDSRQSWRKIVFPFYKAHRKNDRAKLDIDWPSVFAIFDSIKKELKEYTQWPVIEVTGAEGDDVIAALILRYPQQANLIVSADGDFKQLQGHANCKQYDPIRHKMVSVDDPKAYLREHIIRGDRGDGVPNILSDDDVFVNASKRQGKVTEKRLEEWNSTPVEQWSETLRRNYSRNKRLIDLTSLPPKLIANIEAAYDEATSSESKHRMYQYFIDYKLNNLLDCIADFESL